MREHKNINHLLVIDDDTRIRNLLQKYLLEHGYLVSTAKDTKEADSLMNNLSCDLIILDLMMPGESGLEFAKRLTTKNSAPIIMLSAMGESEDRIHGLEVGADDYLVKPFEPKELLLRIAKLLKRKTVNENIFYFGKFSYDTLAKTLAHNDQLLFLTQSEHSLLYFLIKNHNQIVTREELASELAISERSVDVQIVRLRAKIEENSARPKFLQTIRGQGYSLRAS
jgi:two-component system phosphate regulon response regulator OmpR